jgi:hypothetical protein
MLYIGLLVGFMIGAAIVLAWYVRSIDGKVNQGSPLFEPYAATMILGPSRIWTVTFLFELASCFPERLAQWVMLK